MLNNKFILKQILINKTIRYGSLIILIIILLSIISSNIINYDPNTQNLNNAFLPPFWMENGNYKHILGTDDFGRDIYIRIIYAIKTTLISSLIIVSLSLFFGIILGIFTGFYSGFIDLIFLWINSILSSMPSILLVIAIVSILGQNLINAIIAISLVGIPLFANLIREEFKKEKEKNYVIYCQMHGMNNFKLIFNIILPNISFVVFHQIAKSFVISILELVGISFLGFGAQVPTAELGLILSDSLQYISNAPWLIIYPGITIFIIVMSFNLVADGLNNILNSKHRGI